MATDVGTPALEELKAQVRGEVREASEAGVPDAFNLMHEGSPQVSVSCSGTADVSDAVRYAQASGLEVCVRGGGHSVAGLSTIDGGMLIDLSPMTGVHVDPERKIVRVQGGARWGDVDRETQVHGLVVPGGVVSDTGVGGLTLGGGYGWVRRKYGLSVDSLLEAEIVGPDGEVRTASADSSPDLFWALRGGGGNFGVVTSFTFRLHPLGPMVAFAATMYPVEEVAQVMRGWHDYTQGAPDEVTSVCVTITFPANPEMPEAIHDRPVAIIGGVHAGGVDEGMAEMQPLRELGTVLFDMSGPTPFTGVQTGFDPLFPRGAMRAYWKTQYFDELSDEAIDLYAAKAQERPAPMTLVNMFQMGGAIAGVDPEETAFAHRSPSYMLSVDGMWTDPVQDDEVIGFVRGAVEEFKQFGTGGEYLNFTGIADEAKTASVDSAFGRNLQRLAEVKAAHDPENFFRHNNNIEPASS